LRRAHRVTADLYDRTMVDTEPGFGEMADMRASTLAFFILTAP